MKKVHTSIRLKQIMDERNLKQVDILRLTKPISDEYGERLEKNDLSQYVSGKTEPGQRKLFILGKALGINPAWLMGLDVTKDYDDTPDTSLTTLPRQTGEHPFLTPTQEKIISNCQQLNDIGQQKVLDFSDDLVSSNNYSVQSGAKIAALGGIATKGEDQPPIEEKIIT